MISGFSYGKVIVPFLSHTGTWLSLPLGRELSHPEHRPVICLPNLVSNSVTAIVRSTTNLSYSALLGADEMLNSRGLCLPMP
mmetsp:Transcript_20861/g.25596  ORF Transcript_20861/g.25596 Transcript_20861/m.25596 type:complete len:82 (-) Transcript_20861:1216-1461(-)